MWNIKEAKDHLNNMYQSSASQQYCIAAVLGRKNNAKYTAHWKKKKNQNQPKSKPQTKLTIKQKRINLSDEHIKNLR